MLRTYGCCLPDEAGKHRDELKQCLGKIAESIDAGLVPVKTNIYVSSPDYDSFLVIRNECYKEIEAFFGDSCPAVNISAHPPQHPFHVASETLFIEKGSGVVTSRSYKGLRYTIVESEAGKELWAAGISTYQDPHDTRKAASGAFELMIQMLDNENFTVNNLVRQWNYIGEILQINNGLQNYQVFNEVRSEYYGLYRSAGHFPAATGVGMKHGGVILDFCAASYSGDIIIQPVHNPNQVDAYKYGDQVLVGDTEKGKTRKHPPQFERALLICDGSRANLLVSGTASITGQETIGIGDPEKQTLVTIENIKKLSEPESLQRYPHCNQYTVTGYRFLRVYVREQKDFNLARSVCEKYFPGVPCIMIEADICRNDLLIEIETEAVLHE